MCLSSSRVQSAWICHAGALVVPCTLIVLEPTGARELKPADKRGRQPLCALMIKGGFGLLSYSRFGLGVCAVVRPQSQARRVSFQCPTVHGRTRPCSPRMHKISPATHA